ncbi:MAG: NTP transferase domain-containing protein [Saprospiraceae bacterium]
MNESNHKKHGSESRKNIGNFHHNEWAIMGSTCGEINKFFLQINEHLSKNHKVYYIDEDHSISTNYFKIQNKKNILYKHPSEDLNSFDFKFLLNDADMVFINGNHYQAQKQIIIIDDRKKDSLLRKLDKITDLDLVLLHPDKDKVYDFLQDKIKDTTKIIDITQTEKIVKYLKSKLQIPSIKALILAGGESRRMGTDKSQINYHGKPQEQYLLELCEEQSIMAYLSKNSIQDSNNHNQESIIVDRFNNFGPLSGILSAFAEYPDYAWLVMACDLPHLDKTTIARLIKERNPSKYASCYQRPDNEFPEPLITIYEPRSYQRILNFLSLGYSCPRKFLINSDVKIINLKDGLTVKNANTPEEMTAAKDFINNQLDKNRS